MARWTANGAIVSDNGEWAFDGGGWIAVAPSPVTKAPGMISGERRSAVHAMHERMGKSLSAMMENKQALTSAAQELATIVRDVGSVEAAEIQLANKPSGADSAPPTPQAGGSSDDVGGMLRQLAELRDSGVLTEEEFEVKKTELLGRF